MSRKYWIGAGCAVALLCILGAGGFPAKPRFLSVGIGIAAPATTGSLDMVGNTNGGLALGVDNNSNGASNLAVATLSSGDANAALYAAGSGRAAAIVTNGPTGAQSVWRTLGNYPLILGVNNTRHAGLGVNNFSVYGSATGATNLAWYSFRDSAGAEVGWVGDGSSGDTTITLANGVSGGALNLVTTGGGPVQVNGTAISAPIVCTTACAVTSIAVGQTATIRKTAATARTSTTTNAIDPDLQFTSVPSGTYQIQYCLEIEGTTTTTQGYKMSFDRATAGSNVGGWSGVAGVNAVSTAYSDNGLASAGAPGMLFTAADVSTAGDAFCGTGWFISVASTDFGFNWAQEASSANATTVIAGSNIILTRIN